MDPNEALRRAKANEHRISSKEQARAGTYARDLDKERIELWNSWTPLAKEFLSLETDPGVVLTEYAGDGWFRKRKQFAGWYLYTDPDTRDPDSQSRAEPSSYYVLADSRLARGSNRDAVDIVTFEYWKSRAFRPFVETSIKVLKERIAQINYRH